MVGWVAMAIRRGMGGMADIWVIIPVVNLPLDIPDCRGEEIASHTEMIYLKRTGTVDDVP
jgi:hypothetical protein